MGKLAAIAVALGLALAVPALATATWQEPVGGARQVSDIGVQPSLAAVGSVPYVAWTEKHGPSSLLFVARLNASGTAWEKVGGPVNFDSSRDAQDPVLTSVGGVPYVAWNESDGTNVEVRVARLGAAGTSWVEPWKGVDATHGGINENASKNADDTTLAVVNGVPYVGWDEVAGSAIVPRVARLDTSTQPAPTWVEPWTGVSGTSGGFQSSTDAGYSPVVASINNTPYVAWRHGDLTSSGQLHVARLEGSTWQEPWTGVSATSGGISGSSGNTGSLYESRPSLASIGGYPYVAWVESDGTNFDARVARLDTSTFPAPTWTQEAAGVSASDGRINQSASEDALSVSLAAVAAAPFGTEVPYLAWTEHFGAPNNGDYGLRVARYNKATRAWEQPWPGVTSTFGAVGETATTNEHGPSLITVGGVPYLARAAFSADPGLRVSRLEPEFSAQSAGPASGGGEQFGVTARTYGVPYPFGFQYGPALETQTSTVAAAVGSDTVTLAKQVGTLRPNTRYEYRAFAIAGTAAPLAIGPTLAFRTNAAGTGVSTGTGTGSGAVALASVLGERLSRRAFPAAPSGPSVRAAKRRAYGSVVTYNLDRAGTVTFTVSRSQPGRKGAHGRCLRPTRRNRRARHCTRTVTLHGSFADHGGAGPNSFRFTGRLSHKQLRPARYRLVATPTAGSLNGRSSSAAFRIVK